MLSLLVSVPGIIDGRHRLYASPVGDCRLRMLPYLIQTVPRCFARGLISYAAPDALNFLSYTSAAAPCRSKLVISPTSYDINNVIENSLINPVAWRILTV